MPPFLKQVEDLEALQLHLESLSKLSVEFLVLLSGSTVIATFGLFQNSPAVIIGAMIVAPLMRPLVGLSLGTLTGDSKLVSRAAITLVAGTVLGASIAYCLSMIFRSLELTPEILARTHPTLLDLGVAVFAGLIGAYCQSDKKLGESLAGVAISVALVPPLSVVGIGLCFGSPSVYTGAALLYATNLIGITVAGALTFLVMGYIPLHQAKRGLVVSGIVSILLIVPLALSMRELVLENQISIKTKTILTEKTVTFRGVQVGDVRVERFKEPMIVTATIFSPERPINSRQVGLVQDFLTKELKVPVEFKIRLIPVTLITPNEVQTIPSLDGQPAPSETLTPPTSQSNLNSDQSLESNQSDKTVQESEIPIPKPVDQETQRDRNNAEVQQDPPESSEAPKLQ